jgi:hypothetical protein
MKSSLPWRSNSPITAAAANSSNRKSPLVDLLMPADRILNSFGGTRSALATSCAPANRSVSARAIIFGRAAIAEPPCRACGRFQVIAGRPFGQRPRARALLEPLLERAADVGIEA